MGPARHPFHRLIEWNRIRYVLLLEYNERYDDCIENTCLSKMYDAVEKDDMELRKKAEGQCMQLFWPFLIEDFGRRFASSATDDEQKNVSESVVNMQLSTADGALVALEHSQELSNYGEPMKNPFTELKVYEKAEVKEVAKIHNYVSVVEIGGMEYCVKKLRAFAQDGFFYELSKMRAVSSHPNVMRLCGVVGSGDGFIDGFVMPFISGRALDRIKSATHKEKALWKGKIAEAIRFIHSRDIAWGDAKPGNIMIENESSEPILYDFEGGACPSYVPHKLSATKEGDLHALPLIQQFIEGIPLKQ